MYILYNAMHIYINTYIDFVTKVCVLRVLKAQNRQIQQYVAIKIQIFLLLLTQLTAQSVSKIHIIYIYILDIYIYIYLVYIINVYLMYIFCS